MPVNWEMGLAPQTGLNALAAFKAGREERKAADAQNAMTAYAQNPNDQTLNALAPFNPDFVVKSKQDQAASQQQAALKGVEMIGQAALMADTPEKWDQAVDYLSQLHPELAKYKGRFDMRETAISAAGQAKAYIEQQQPVNVGPGSHLVDPKSGKALFSAPFAPRPVTLSEGQTAVEYNPNGNPWAGVAVNVAKNLGLKPEEVAAVMSYETGGSFSPTVMGGKGGNYMGLIQFGPEERAKYGIDQNSTPEQWTNAILGFMQDRGFKPGMGIADFYSTINAGSPGRYGASDGNGTVTDHVGRILTQHMKPAQDWLNGGQGRVIGKGAPKAEKPKWRTLSAEEAQKMGLPAGTYQQSPDGEVKPIGGVGAKAAQSSQAYSQSAMDAFDRAIGTADRLLKHPGLEAAVGVKGLTGGLLGGWVMPGTDAADFNAELDAMKTQVFLPMVQSMKGMGALSNAEGEKLTASIGALSPKMSESAFKASLKRIIDDLNTYKQRAGQQPAQAASGGWGKAKVVQ